MIEYTIIVTNSSTTTAAGAVTVGDNIPANTTFFPGSITLNGGGAAGHATSSPVRRREWLVNAGAVAANARHGDGQVPSDDQQLIDAQSVIADCDTQRGRGGE